MTTFRFALAVCLTVACFAQEPPKDATKETLAGLAGLDQLPRDLVRLPGEKADWEFFEVEDGYGVTYRLRRTFAKVLGVVIQREILGPQYIIRFDVPMETEPCPDDGLAFISHRRDPDLVKQMLDTVRVAWERGAGVSILVSDTGFAFSANGCKRPQIHRIELVDLRES